MSTNGPMLGEPLPVELMNTIWADRDGVHDTLDSVDGVRGWLTDIAVRTLVSTSNIKTLSDSDVGAATVSLRVLRDALRRLAAETTGDPRPDERSPTMNLTDAVALLNAAAAATHRWTSLNWTTDTSPSMSVHASDNVGRAITTAIAEEAIELFAGEGKALLRACLAPGCVLYFLKSHPRREWCSPGCGNRARVARHYARHGQR